MNDNLIVDADNIVEPEVVKVRKIPKPKAPSIKIIKYHKARLKGLNKEQSKRVAGFSPNTLTSTIEKTDAYKSISVGSAIQAHISLDEIARLHAETIRQSDDLTARNKATQLAYDRIEPNNSPPEQQEHVIVVLKES